MRLVEQRKFTPLFMSDTMTADGDGDSDGGSLFDPTLCALTVEGASVLDSGGNTFECYDVGTYENDLQNSGTGIVAIYSGESPWFVAEEPFEIFDAGTLTSTTPSTDSHMTVMNYGENPWLQLKGDEFDAYAVGTITSGTPAASTGYTAYYVG